MRIFSVGAGLLVAAGLGCGSSAKPDQAAKSKPNEAYDPRTRSPFRLDTGQTIARAESRYAVIKNDSCPGVRVANTRFQAAQELVVQMTEDNTSLQCTEGTVTRPIAVVWHTDRPSAPPDTIRASGESLSIVGGSVGPTTEHSVPLLDAFEYDEGGIGPSSHVYYSLLTGKQLFMTEPPILTFVANGTRRYIAVRGGGKDTLATVAYGNGAGEPQVIRITPKPGETVPPDPLFAVDSVSLDGPRSNGEVVIGGAIAKDTVAVSGITVRFRIGDVSSGADDSQLSYVVQIVNDRLVLASPPKP